MIFIIILLLLLFLPSKAGAVWSEYKYPVASSSASVWVSADYTKLSGDDLGAFTSFVCNPGTGSPCYQALKFNFPEANNMKITAIQSEIKFKYRDNNVPGSSISVGFRVNFADNLYTPTMLNAYDSDEIWTTSDVTTWQTAAFYWSDSEGYPDVSNYFNDHKFNGNIIYLPYFHVYGSYGRWIDVDYVKVRVNYDDPTTLNIEDFVASESAQTMFVDFTGDVATKGANIYCNVDLFEDCTSELLSNFRSQSSIATIELDPNYSDNITYKISGKTYQGYGYSATSSAWRADKVEVPYNSGYICTYPRKTTCLERIYSCNTWDDGSVHCSWTDEITHVDVWSEGGASINFGVEVEPDDIVGKIIFRLKKLFNDLFMPDKELTEMWVLERYNQIMEHAPFAYFAAITTQNWSFVEEAETFSVDFPIYISDTNKTTVPITIPHELDTFFQYFRQFMEFGLTLAFVSFAFKLGRRVF